MSDEFLIPPPSSITVDHEHRARLYTHDGRPLVRQAGFTAGRPASPPQRQGIVYGHEWGWEMRADGSVRSWDTTKRPAATAKKKR